MRHLLTLLLFATLVPCRAQRLTTEDSLLRIQLELGEISVDKYRAQAENLRDLVRAAGGYPRLPLGPSGTYEMVTTMVNDNTKEENWKAVRRWLALGGFSGERQLDYLDEEEGRIIVELSAPFILKGGLRQTIPHAAGWSAAPTTVSCVLDVRTADGTVTARWLRPVLTEYHLVPHTVGDGGVSSQVVH